LAGVLRNVLRGDNLASVHFHEDNSGDIDNVEDVGKTNKETLAELAAEQSYRCQNGGGKLDVIKKWKEEAVKEINE
jgi:hypothetical protein